MTPSPRLVAAVDASFHPGRGGAWALVVVAESDLARTDVLAPLHTASGILPASVRRSHHAEQQGVLQAIAFLTREHPDVRTLYSDCWAAVKLVRRGPLRVSWMPREFWLLRMAHGEAATIAGAWLDCCASGTPKRKAG